MPTYNNLIGGVMVSVLVLSAVAREVEPRSGQPKDYKIGIFFFSTKHGTVRSKSKDWLSWNKDNVSTGVSCLTVDNCFSELS